MLIVGSNESPIMTSLLKLNDAEIISVCSNILDYELPALVKNTPPHWHRDELREVLRVIAPENYKISSSLKNLLEENDRLQLDELGLAITTHISQIEQNSQSLEIAYELLSKETGVDNFSVHPLVDEFSGLIVFKNKKYAPLRYYLEQEELLKDTPPAKEGATKRKQRKSH